MKIGVFDSGVGGESVANAVRAALPEHQVLFVNDVAHLPYGSKSPAEILGYVEPILEQLVTDGCVAIVVACNTVSTTLIEELRKRIAVPLVATEPMVKTAAGLTKTGVIAVCATPTTLASKRYDWLKTTYALNLVVVEPDCSDWTYMIENNQVDMDKIEQRIDQALDAKADVIVLGCTHYHWIEEDIRTLVAGRATVIQPEPAIVEQLKRVLSRITA